MTATDKTKLREAIRAAIVAQAQRWDAEHAIEEALGGVEIETEDSIKMATFNVSGPTYEVPEDLIDDLVEEFTEEATP